MKKLTFKLILLLLIVISINQLMIYWLPFGWGDKRMYVKYKFYREHADDYNTLFLGTSRTYRHIAPQVVDANVSEDLNIKSFNLGMQAYSFPRPHLLLKHTLENKPPNLQYVILEISHFGDNPGSENLHTTQVKYWYNLEYTLFYLRYVAHTPRNPLRKLRIYNRHVMTLFEKYFNIGMGVDILDLMIEADFDEAQKSLGVNHNGFYPLDEETGDEYRARREAIISDPNMVVRRKNESRQMLNASPNNQAYNPVYLEKIQELLELSEAHNVKLIFYLPPRLGRDYEQLLPLLKQIPDENKIILADPDLYPEFYRLDKTYDIAHLNYEGAILFSELLAEKLNLLLEDDSELAKEDD